MKITFHILPGSEQGSGQRLDTKNGDIPSIFLDARIGAKYLMWVKTKNHKYANIPMWLCVCDINTEMVLQTSFQFTKNIKCIKRWRDGECHHINNKSKLNKNYSQFHTPIFSLIQLNDCTSEQQRKVNRWNDRRGMEQWVRVGRKKFREWLTLLHV